MKLLQDACTMHLPHSQPKWPFQIVLLYSGKLPYMREEDKKKKKKPRNNIILPFLSKILNIFRILKTFQLYLVNFPSRYIFIFNLPETSIINGEHKLGNCPHNADSDLILFM